MRAHQPCSLGSWLGPWEQPGFPVWGGGRAAPGETTPRTHGLDALDLGLLSKDSPGRFRSRALRVSHVKGSRACAAPRSLRDVTGVFLPAWGTRLCWVLRKQPRLRRAPGRQIVILV